MTRVEVKVCGLTDEEALAAAIDHGARFVGFVFFARSPRRLSPTDASRLAAMVPAAVNRVGVVVDADDQLLDEVLPRVPLEFLQCHGSESLARVAEIRSRYGVKVIKAIGVDSEADLETAAAYEEVADMLLFDSRQPRGSERPGGNAVSFHWPLLRSRRWRRPWLLAGGLDLENLAAAVGASGARLVDVSSGVEDAPGHKVAAKIAAFLARARSLDAGSSSPDPIALSVRDELALGSEDDGIREHASART